MSGPGPGASAASVTALGVALLVVAGYLLATGRAGSHRPWPRARTASWLVGVAALLVASIGPLEQAGDHSFAAHAAAHVLLGMLGPLLLVRAAPVTLALRALPVRSARRLSRLLRRRLVRLLTEPLVAAATAVGGLWLIYRTSIYALSHDLPAVHLLVHLHLVGAGLLLAVALVSPDPMPHRRPAAHRAVVLVAAVAGHDILAKSLYAHPPAGVSDGRIGAMVMYYAGDAVEVAMMVLLCAAWFRRPRSSSTYRVSISGRHGDRDVDSGQASKPARSTRRW